MTWFVHTEAAADVRVSQIAPTNAGPRLALMCLAVLLAACGTRASAPVPVHDEAGAPAARVFSNAAAYEQRLRDTAAAQERANRLAEAATAWEILTVIKPDSAEYRDHLHDVRRLAEASLAEKMARAEAAQKKGDIDTATTQYLGALAIDPANSRAADGLRSVERERNRRTVLGKASRLTLTKRSIAESQAQSSVSVPLDRNELEYATMLGKQGEYDDAIALLEARLATNKGDTAARLLLADLYAQMADKRLPRDRPGAAAALGKSLRLDPSNAGVALRLRQLKSGAVAAGRPAAVSRAGSSVRPVAAPATVSVMRPARAARGPSRIASGAARAGLGLAARSTPDGGAAAQRAASTDSSAPRPSSGH